MRRRRISFSSDPRRTALKRAGLAVATALVLLAAVLWFGDDGQPSRPSVESANIDIDPAQLSVPKADSPALESDTTARTIDKPAETPAPVSTEEDAGTATPEATGPEPRAVVLPESPKAPADKLSSPPETLNKPSTPPKTVDAPVKPVSLQDGYFVQLGVFDDTDNVGKVFDNAVALGLPAHIQSRVVVGPFSNKREAEAARDRLKKIAEGVVLPPQKTAKASENPKAKPRRRTK